MYVLIYVLESSKKIVCLNGFYEEKNGLKAKPSFIFVSMQKKKKKSYDVNVNFFNGDRPIFALEFC
jgi:hypothetical protein